MKLDEWRNYAGRLGWAMRRSGRTNQSELARAIGVKPQAIQYLCDAEAGARGSSHTPALARELGVRADWLARGDGEPLEPAGVVVSEPAPPGQGRAALLRVPVSGTLNLRADGRQAPRRGRAAAAVAEAPDGGVLMLPSPSPACHAMRVEGQGLAPYAPQGHFLVLASNAPLQANDLILVSLRNGGTRLCQLLLDRDDALVVTPWQGGVAEVLTSRQVAGVSLVVCALSPRWWQAAHQLGP